MSNKDLNPGLNQDPETENREIVALKLQIEDPETGATADYHVLDSYYVSKSGNYAEATFATYVSAQTFKRGRSPVSRGLRVSVNPLPEQCAGIEQHFYASAVADETPLKGAEKVFAQEA